MCAKTWGEKSCLQRKRLFVEWTAGPYTAENSYLLSVEYLPLHAGLRFAFVLQLGSSYVRHDLDDFIFCLEGSAVSAIVMSDRAPQFKDQYLEKAASHWSRVQ